MEVTVDLIEEVASGKRYFHLVRNGANMIVAVALILGLLAYLGTSERISTNLQGTCPNNCGSGGICIQTPGHSPSGVCNCFPGFYGLDCSLRLCPAGNAWVDFPSSDDVAHASNTECSNMGICDRNTGKCKCRTGFGGPSCELLMCPLGRSIRDRQEQCSGHGRCLSLREAAKRQDYIQFIESTTYDEWDADMLQSCACDEGWSGRSCELRSCPKGDDPDTPGVDEVQLIECSCTTNLCEGGIYLSYKGEKTLKIPYNAPDNLIKYRLEELSTIEEVDVHIKIGTLMCSEASDSSLTAITIKLPQGDSPPLILETYGGLSGTITTYNDGAYSMVDPHIESAKGTKEHVECSNRGFCNYNSGICRCLPGFQSSDGYGNTGHRGDCGYRYANDIDVTTRDALYNSSADAIPVVYHKDTEAGRVGVTSTTNCPFVPEVGICSNHGTCDPNTNTCTCDTGYTGVVCDQKTCGVIRKWVGEVGADHINTEECGGIGTCNVATGLCEKCGGNYNVFQGNSCETLSCPSEGSGQWCGGNGYCRSMKDLAGFAYNEDKTLATSTYESNWDAERIKGCACQRSPSVDNVFHSDYTQYLADWSNTVNMTGDSTKNANKFYRGPYAHSVTDFWGFECGFRRCPNGDDPSTRNGKNEIQIINCQATEGSFTLKFRENTTMTINYDDPFSVFAYRLEQLYTIHAVDVTYYEDDLETKASSDTFCTSDGSNYVYIEFLSEHGDLPLISWTDIDLLDSGTTPTFVISEHRAGTKEDIECSGQGICNEYNGICECRQGFGSSDGTSANAGGRGDCSFFNRYDS